MAALTSLEVAERIGVSPSTLKNWAVRLPVPSLVGLDGERRYPAEAIAVLETVKSLREGERSYDTIRRVIGESPAPAVALTTWVPPVSNSLRRAELRIADLEHALRLFEGERARLSRELAEATSRIGRLEVAQAARRPWWRLW